jgi:hypothetical protein
MIESVTLHLKPSGEVITSRTTKMFADPIVCATDAIHGLVEGLGANFAALPVDLLASSKRYGQVFIVWAVGEICLRCEGNPAPLASVAQTLVQGLIALLPVASWKWRQFGWSGIPCDIKCPIPDDNDDDDIKEDLGLAV